MILEDIDDLLGISSRCIITATWADARHLSKSIQDELAKTIPEYQRDARMKGIPHLGSGRIYPFELQDILVDDFDIPDHYHFGYGLDVGWNRTAAPFMAVNRETDVVYLYSEHYQGGVSPNDHAAAIKARGTWQHGFIDPSANGERKAEDGEQLTETYRGLGLNLTLADNAVESGIYEVWIRLTTGRLKVFKSCRYWQDEFKLYRRDDRGKPVKRNDHLMDSMRYGIKHIADWVVKPKVEAMLVGPGGWQIGGESGGSSWMGA